jgi:hypothetical protein
MLGLGVDWPRQLSGGGYAVRSRIHRDRQQYRVSRQSGLGSATARGVAQLLQ